MQSVDGFGIKATLEYPKVKGKKDYSTVVLLHSLGYSSQWWETLPKELTNSGYAVLKIDLRGHGKSVYNSRLVRTSWKSMTNSAYAKYPDDVIKVVEFVKAENSKKTFFNNWAIVGADIGASTAILAADKIANKPKTIVLLSPVVKTRGLYVPVKLANLNMDIFQYPVQTMFQVLRQKNILRNLLSQLLQHIHQKQIQQVCLCLRVIIPLLKSLLHGLRNIYNLALPASCIF